jgi:hypothetical protein
MRITNLIYVFVFLATFAQTCSAVYLTPTVINQNSINGTVSYSSSPSVTANGKGSLNPPILAIAGIGVKYTVAELPLPKKLDWAITFSGENENAVYGAVLYNGHLGCFGGLNGTCGPKPPNGWKMQGTFEQTGGIPYVDLIATAGVYSKNTISVRASFGGTRERPEIPQKFVDGNDTDEDDKAKDPASIGGSYLTGATLPVPVVGDHGLTGLVWSNAGPASSSSTPSNWTPAYVFTS